SPLSIEVTQAVSAGSLTMNQDGSFQYDPQGFSGPATFAYRISDGQTPSAPVTVSLRVNSAPTAVNDSYSVDEDASLTVTAATGILQNDTDAEGDTLTLTVISETANGEVEVEPTGEFTYTPNPDFSGEDQFTYVVNDGLVDSPVGVVRIQVVGVNDAPVGRSDVIILPGGGTQQIAASDGVLANDSDIDGPTLTALLETAPQTGSIELAADGSFRYTPGPAFNRLDRFTYRVTDGTATSEPISVTLVQAADPGNSTPKGDSIVTFNEVMYNPVGDADSQLEWIELHNQMAINMDISRWSLGGGIDFFFPEGTVIPGGGFLVVAANPEEFTAATGQTNVMGPFSGRLANDGEELLLINNSQRIMDRMVYSDSGDWPVAADGSGATLTKKFRHSASGEADSWTFSSNVGGSPGAANPTEDDVLPALVFNEIAAASDETFRLELANLSSESVSLAGWGITTDDSLTPVYALGDGTLSAGGYLVVTESQLGFQPADQQRLFLVHTDGTVADARQVTGRLRGRAAELDYAWEYPATETFGAANQFQFQSDIVINEIMYHAAGFYVPEIDKYFDSPEEWVELYNQGDAAVDLSAWAFSEGIRYEFAAGTALGAGQYLVLAKDPAALIGRYDHLTAANTFGPYDGQLADGGERLRLNDAVGNPADVVTYFDGGRWHDTADGYGSSLELKDPASDNAVAESWAPSDEASKTAWQTITYSGSGRNNLNDPQQYHEFLLGMLDAGEVLIDDVTVKVNPGQADEAQLIQNGTFEADILGSSPATWRIIGTQHGTVVSDPDNPENQVLRLVATGPTEHMHNNAGTTLKDGDTFHRISNSSDYEISFKAKLVSGSAQLNSRLYFNRLPKTTRLDRPENGGTPGLVNSTFVSNAGPTYDGLIHSPIIPDVNQAMTVSVNAFDPQGVQSMTLYYSVNGGEFASVPMTLVGQKYAGTIPGQAEGAAVQFYVEATDAAGGMSQFPAAGPDSRALIRVNDGQSDDSPLHELRIVMTPEDTSFLHETTNVMSNDRLGATVIYNDHEVFYDVGVRLKGSQRGRDKVVRAGFNLQFDPMQLFRDVHSTIGID
ncbi:MAG: tandem-95 repeat protein, partial [Planctomycetales bacterium]|nr:tandem-95 repeat protein [Planctomycetales bacterium]